MVSQTCLANKNFGLSHLIKNLSTKYSVSTNRLFFIEFEFIEHQTSDFSIMGK